jgi:hypothetical protein
MLDVLNANLRLMQTTFNTNNADQPETDLNLGLDTLNALQEYGYMMPPQVADTVALDYLAQLDPATDYTDPAALAATRAELASRYPMQDVGNWTDTQVRQVSVKLALEARGFLTPYDASDSLYFVSMLEDYNEAAGIYEQRDYTGEAFESFIRTVYQASQKAQTFIHAWHYALSDLKSPEKLGAVIVGTAEGFLNASPIPWFIDSVDYHIYARQNQNWDLANWGRFRQETIDERNRIIEANGWNNLWETQLYDETFAGAEMGMGIAMAGDGLRQIPNLVRGIQNLPSFFRSIIKTGYYEGSITLPSLHGEFRLHPNGTLSWIGTTTYTFSYAGPIINTAADVRSLEQIATAAGRLGIVAMSTHNPGGGQENRVRDKFNQQGYQESYGSSDEDIRKNLGMSGKCADVVANDPQTGKWVIAESKGTRVEDALKQIRNTANGLINKEPLAAGNIAAEIYVGQSQYNALSGTGLYGYRIDQSGFLYYIEFNVSPPQVIYELVDGQKVLVNLAP